MTEEKINCFFIAEVENGVVVKVQRKNPEYLELMRRARRSNTAVEGESFSAPPNPDAMRTALEASMSKGPIPQEIEATYVFKSWPELLEWFVESVLGSGFTIVSKAESS